MTSDRAVTTTVGARALASRRNGARSRGPRTAAGKARSARNALKHGLCATKLLVLPQENAAQFEALSKALLDELAPVGALQMVLAHRVVSAAWRLLRADRMEAEVLDFRGYRDANLGLALIRATAMPRRASRPCAAAAPPPRPSCCARSPPSRRSRPRPRPRRRRRPPAAAARTPAPNQTNPGNLARATA